MMKESQSFMMKLNKNGHERLKYVTLLFIVFLIIVPNNYCVGKAAPKDLKSICMERPFSRICRGGVLKRAIPKLYNMDLLCDEYLHSRFIRTALSPGAEDLPSNSKEDKDRDMTSNLMKSKTDNMKNNYLINQLKSGNKSKLLNQLLENRQINSNG